VVNFQDETRIQRVLTPRRLELIRSLMEAPADSIRDLADRLDRDIRQVHDDVQLLNEYRIVQFEEEGGAKKPFVPYETVTIEVELVSPSSEDAESSASA
jgi:predicted transcriptional regulator